MKKAFITFLALLLVFSFVGCKDSNTKEPSTDTAFGLNDTAEFPDLKITATEIKESTGNSLFTPEAGKVFVGVKFTIENTSKEDQVISSLLLFTAYADDVKCSYSISATTTFADGTIDGTVAPGKKLVGWYAVEMPEDWKVLELDFKADVLSKTTAKFVFSAGECTDADTGSNTGSGSNDNINQPSTDTTYGPNETATLKNLKVTATEIKESQGESFLKPDSGNVFVGVKFTIENASNEDQTISSLLQFTAYADDVKCNFSISAVSAFPNGTLDGSVAVGKQLVGWYAVEVPENWQTIEIDFQEDLLSGAMVSFVFEN